MSHSVQYMMAETRAGLCACRIPWDSVRKGCQESSTSRTNNAPQAPQTSQSCASPSDRSTLDNNRRVGVAQTPTPQGSTQDLGVKPLLVFANLRGVALGPSVGGIDIDHWALPRRVLPHGLGSHSITGKPHWNIWHWNYFCLHEGWSCSLPHYASRKDSCGDPLFAEEEKLVRNGREKRIDYGAHRKRQCQRGVHLVWGLSLPTTTTRAHHTKQSEKYPAGGCLLAAVLLTHRSHCCPARWRNL